MDSLFSLRLDALKAQLAGSRLEKSSLYTEIACPTTEAWRKQEAMLRVVQILAELRKISSELDMLKGKH